jgi:formate hydrogenlyase subunit 3/multisubunit Na+/H+ antiporter MnhD subunit
LRIAKIIAAVGVSIAALYLGIIQVFSAAEPFIQVSSTDRLLTFACCTLFLLIVFASVARDSTMSALATPEWHTSLLRRTLIGILWAVVADGAFSLYLVLTCAKHGACL